MLTTRSSDTSRNPFFKRFTVPRRFGVDPASCIERGKTWPAAQGATRVKRFEIYRYDPDWKENPRLDSYEIDIDNCGPMVLDALHPYIGLPACHPSASRGCRYRCHCQGALMSNILFRYPDLPGIVLHPPAAKTS